MDEAISPKAFDNFIETAPGHGALTNQLNRAKVHIIGTPRVKLIDLPKLRVYRTAKTSSRNIPR